MGKKAVKDEEFAFRPFEDLKKLYTKNVLASKKPPPPPEEKKIYSDKEIFLDAMKDVRKILEYTELPLPLKKIKKPAQTKKHAENEIIRELSDITQGCKPLDLPVTQEYVEWLNPDYLGDFGKDILKRLHEGKFSVRDYIDLHGFTAEEAGSELRDFIQRVSMQRMSCVKIIHGRGLRSPSGPVLKNIIIRLLTMKYRKKIIAFASARQCDGGLGALYVLLKV